jgi:hypothetical protein
MDVQKIRRRQEALRKSGTGKTGESTENEGKINVEARLD